VRRVGGGRKKLTETDLTLIADLELLVEPKGDPMSLTQWTTKSLATLVSALAKKRHVIKKSALAEVLSSLGFSLKANKKNIEGVSHPDRDLQFRHIARTCATFEKKSKPIISVEIHTQCTFPNARFSIGWTTSSMDTCVIDQIRDRETLSV
jgi:hypothetical protein